MKRPPTCARYHQSSGVFQILAVDDGGQERILYEALGYAGRAEGRNNADLQEKIGIGPLPRGSYSVGLPHTHPRLGPIAFRLRPTPETQMFGRSAFFIHGDNRRNDASYGCIVLPRRDRENIAALNVRSLVVEA